MPEKEKIPQDFHQFPLHRYTGQPDLHYAEGLRSQLSSSGFPHFLFLKCQGFQTGLGAFQHWNGEVIDRFLSDIGSWEESQRILILANAPSSAEPETRDSRFHTSSFEQSFRNVGSRKNG